MSGRGLGQRTGGKGSWRRKVKKTNSSASEGDKVWLAAQRLGCRDIGEIDTASMIIAGEKEALSFAKPSLAIDMRANTYVLHGKAEKKPISEVFTEMLSGIDFSKFGGDKKDDELGDVENVDFSKPEEEAEQKKDE